MPTLADIRRYYIYPKKKIFNMFMDYYVDGPVMEKFYHNNNYTLTFTTISFVAVTLYLKHPEDLTKSLNPNCRTNILIYTDNDPDGDMISFCAENNIQIMECTSGLLRELISDFRPCPVVRDSSSVDQPI